MNKLTDKFWWQNKFKYWPLSQRFFLLANLSRSFPALLNIEPTNQCNLHCRFCPIAKSNRRQGMMSWKMYQKIINQISRQKKLSVLWLNKDGEPLLHPKVAQMAAYAKQKNVAQRVEIYTNGLLLNKSQSRALIKVKLDSLVISLDAVDQQDFKQKKGIDGYKKVTDNIDQFLKLRMRLGQKRPFLVLKTIDFGQFRQVRRFKKQWRSIADQVIVQPLHEWESTINSKIRKFENSKIRRRYPCNLPWLAPAINWDGRVTSCCVNYRENELILGDINRQPLAKIFQNSSFKKLRQAHLKLDFKKFPTCARCQYWQHLPDMSAKLRRLGA